MSDKLPPRSRPRLAKPGEFAPKPEEDRTGFIARRKREQERFLIATDAHFWLRLEFANQERRAAFLNWLNWNGYVQEDYGELWIDGTELVRDLDLYLPPVDLSTVRGAGIHPRLSRLAAPLNTQADTADIAEDDEDDVDDNPFAETE